MHKKIYFFILSMLMCLNSFAAIYVTKDILQQKKSSYLEWLDSLYNKIRWAPTAAIQMGAVTFEGYTQKEADAIPAAYPFLYDQMYKKLINKLASEKYVQTINELLNDYYQAIAKKNPKTYQEKRTILHELFHKKNVEFLGLASSTTTKEIADKVEKKSVNIHKLCDIQLAEFFVKYYLEL